MGFTVVSSQATISYSSLGLLMALEVKKSTVIWGRAV